MTATSHTPGPWTVEDPLGPETLWIVEAGKATHEWRCIAMVCRDPPIGAGEQQANARLIAAAPETAAERDRLRDVNAELVAALRRVRGSFEDANGKVFLGWRDEADAVDAALAKAEGR